LYFAKQRSLPYKLGKVSSNLPCFWMMIVRSTSSQSSPFPSCMAFLFYSGVRKNSLLWSGVGGSSNKYLRGPILPHIIEETMMCGHCQLLSTAILHFCSGGVGLQKLQHYHALCCSNERTTVSASWIQEPNNSNQVHAIISKHQIPDWGSEQLERSKQTSSTLLAVVFSSENFLILTLIGKHSHNQVRHSTWQVLVLSCTSSTSTAVLGQ
jgi:hypothetical protein